MQSTLTMNRAQSQAYGTGNFTYTWDPANRQTLIVNPSSKTATIGYDPAGRTLQKLFANTAVTTHAYDPAGNVTMINNQAPVGGTSTVLTYAYDHMNHRTVQVEQDGTVTTWTYDNTYQLTNEHRTTSTGSDAIAFNITYTYDPVGNRATKVENGAVTTYTYTPANRLTLIQEPGAVITHTYDGAGNLTSELTPTGNVYYTWDAPGRMVNAEPVSGVVTYMYNAENQRVGKKLSDGSTIGFLYNFNNLLQETDGFGGDIDKTYTALINEPYGDLISESGSEIYHQHDAQWSANALSDDAGNSTAPIRNTAFGLSASNAGEAWTTLSTDEWANMSVDDWAGLPVNPQSNMGGFGGQRQYYIDVETGFYILGMGVGGSPYDPDTGRFTRESPMRQARGDNNLYPIVGNNPVNFSDTLGYCFAAETRILLADGTMKPIGQVAANDLVLAIPETDPHGKSEPRRVLEAYHNAPARLLHVHVAGESVRPTVNHPFYVKDRGWIPAGKLMVGDQLITQAASYAAVEAIEDLEQIEPVFNLHVEGAHTYFVLLGLSQTAVLVHNSSYPGPMAADAPRSHGDDKPRPQAWTDAKEIVAAYAGLPTDSLSLQKEFDKKSGFNDRVLKEVVIIERMYALADDHPSIKPQLAEWINLLKQGAVEARGADEAEKNQRNIGSISTDQQAFNERHAEAQKIVASGKNPLYYTFAEKNFVDSMDRQIADNRRVADYDRKGYGVAARLGSEFLRYFDQTDSGGGNFYDVLYSLAPIGIANEQRAAADSARDGLESARAHDRAYGGSAYEPPPRWLQNVYAGSDFNDIQSLKYPSNEVYVEGKTTDYLKLDSYNPTLGEIVSRKSTQLSEVKPSTAINYIKEIAKKYAPGTKIANVPSNGVLRGQRLQGQMILEVPVQSQPIPHLVLDAAKENAVLIRDVNGKVY